MADNDVDMRDVDMRIDRYAREYGSDPEFVAEGLALSVTEEMLECLAQKNFSQSWLAEQMGVSRAHVSRILNARPNMTLRTIAKIAVALGVKPHVRLNSDARSDSEQVIEDGIRQWKEVDYEKEQIKACLKRWEPGKKHEHGLVSTWGIGSAR